MKGCKLYNGANLDSTGGAYSNPYDMVQKGGKRRKSKKARKTKKKRSSSRKTKKSCLASKSLLATAYKWFNIY